VIEAETRYARAEDGVRIAYQTTGFGAYDIVFVPGAISHLDLAWHDPESARWIHGLSRLGRVTRIDRRGVGLSDRLSPGDVPPAEVVAEDVGVVLDTIGAPQAVLFGFAEGAGICSLFAAMHPDRVQGLITYAMWTHIAGDDLAEWMQWLEWAPERWGSSDTAAYDARQLTPSRAGDATYVAYIGETQRGGVSPGALRTLFEVSLALDVRNVLPAIRVPSLVMYREHDHYMPTESLRAAAELIPGSEVVPLPGIDHWVTAEPQQPMFDAVEAFLGTLGSAPAQTHSRHLATVLFTDIVGSTARSADLGDAAWKELLEQHHRTVRSAIDRHGGREISTAGDGFFATFDGPAAAATSAVEAAREVRSLGLEIRSGVHTGEVESIDGEVGGLGVTIGARIGAVAGPSEVLVSSTVKDLAAGAGLTFEAFGERELKGVPGTWQLYRVIA
jgi:class 3 adenylate cyclase